jgi:hypothetical protein
LLGIALLGVSAPALGFSLTQQLQVSYSAQLNEGWDVGIQGRFDLDLVPDPVGASLLVRPYIRFTADLVDNDEASLSVFVRARVPMRLDLAPAPAVPSFSLNLQAGLDFSYYASKDLSWLSGLEFDSEFASDFDYVFSGFSELDLDLDGSTLYTGFSFDQLLPFPAAVTYYLGLSAGLSSVASLSLDYSFDLSNAFRSRSFDVVRDSGLMLRLTLDFESPR